ncbi:MAG: hypothetical protein Fur0018_25160 [Anaerolineales bacterium]
MKTLPPENTRCTSVLQDTLTGYAGVRAAQFDLHSGQLVLEYDPRTLRPEHALQLTRKAGRAAWERVQHCQAQSDEACAACIHLMAQGLDTHYRELAQLDVISQVRFERGRMEINLSAPAGESAQAAHPIAPEAAPAAPHWTGIPREKLEVAFTLLTALFGLLAFAGGHLIWFAQAWSALLYGAAFLTGGYYGLLDGVSELWHERRLNVDLLMILAALGAAFVGQPAEGAALLFLFSLSNTLQAYALDRSRKAIEKLLDLRPPTATVRRGSRLVTLPVEDLVLGDVVIVRPGERFPIDGEILEGASTANQASITGESLPVPKAPGDTVFAGTVNGNGALEVRVTRLANDTTLAKIVHMVEEAQESKANTQTRLDTFEQIYALLVLGAAALLVFIPLMLGQPFQSTFYRAMTWLVVASPCALVISTPASILSAIANGARQGILFKGGIHMERTAELRVIAFDKTGTLTEGKPALTDLLPWEGASPAEMLRLAASAEARSEHPLAAAIVQAAETRGVRPSEAAEFQAHTGQGIEALVEGRRIWLGNERMFQMRGVRVPAGLRQQMQAREEEGKTVMLLYAQEEGGGRFLGLLAVADTLREDAADIIAALKRLGIRKTVMLTGDNARVAAAIAAQTGVDEFHAELLPEDKVRVLHELRRKYGPIAMVGDGVNDAPALASADVGIAMGGAGTDVALETADVVLMADDLRHLPYAIGLARRARQVVWQNLIFSLAVIVLLVATTFGVGLPLPLGVVGHEGSTVLVVLNGLRLLRFMPQV